MLTVCATLPLLLLGAEVTTKQVGMVDPVGFREPWHLFVVLERALRELGFLIEHSHRLVGFVVGTCVIVLAVGLWLREPRRWVRWLGLAALSAVCVQGLLGGFRVNLNALIGTKLALIHGCFAQVFFALLVSLALFTSRSWTASAGAFAASHDLAPVRRWSLFTTGMIYMEIVLGAIVRHEDTFLGARAHLLVAFAVLAAVLWVIKLVLDTQPREKPLVRAVLILSGLLTVQLFLGVESWMSKFSSGQSRLQLQQASDARRSYDVEQARAIQEERTRRRMQQAANLMGQARYQDAYFQALAISRDAISGLPPLVTYPELLRSLHYLVGSFVFASAVVVTLQAYRLVALAGRPVAVTVGHREVVA